MNFGLVSGDPAQGMFTTSNFPGASSTDLTNAQNHYAMLTGRISSITREGRIDPVTNTYVVMGESRAQGRMHDIGFYAQDSWRIRPNLTVNYGLRYEIQLPFQALNASYSNAMVADLWGVTGVAPDFIPGALVTNIGYLYQPGVLKGGTPYYREMTASTKAYQTDWNNWAPNVGASWTPYVQDGFLRKLLGEQGDTVLRGGFSTAFQRNGLADFNGLPASQAGDATKYTSTDFSSNTFLSPLNLQNPNPFNVADNLDSTAARRTNAITAGLPSNFLIPNPDMLGGANILGNGGFTTYNGLQVDFRRRLSNGLQLQAKYS